MPDNTARFAQNPRPFDAIIVAQLTNLGTDSPAGVVLLATAGPQGAMIPRIGAMLRASLAVANGIVLFSSNDAGATLRPKGSITMPAQTIGVPSGAVASEALIETEFTKFSMSRPLYLGPNQRLYVGARTTPPAGGIVVHGDIIDFIAPDPA